MQRTIINFTTDQQLLKYQVYNIFILNFVKVAILESRERLLSRF